MHSQKLSDPPSPTLSNLFTWSDPMLQELSRCREADRIEQSTLRYKVPEDSRVSPRMVYAAGTADNLGFKCGPVTGLSKESLTEDSRAVFSPPPYVSQGSRSHTCTHM